MAGHGAGCVITRDTVQCDIGRIKVITIKPMTTEIGLTILNIQSEYSKPIGKIICPNCNGTKVLNRHECRRCEGVGEVYRQLCGAQLTQYSTQENYIQGIMWDAGQYDTTSCDAVARPHPCAQTCAQLCAHIINYIVMDI